MKRLILALLMAGTIATVNAQEPKSILVYGNLDLADGTDSVLFKHINWAANFGVGYQFNEHWTLGANICWGQNATRDSTSYRTTENYYRVGPFARYSHYLNNSNIFFWFTQFELSYEGGYSTNSHGDPSYNKHTGLFANIYPALGLNLCHGICLNFGIGGINYLTDKSQNPTVTYSTNTFNFTFGHMANIGVSKNFNAGHKMHVHHEPGDEVSHRNMEKSEGADDDDAPRRRRVRNSNDDE
jgi:hypothetical protein